MYIYLLYVLVEINAFCDFMIELYIPMGKNCETTRI